MTRTMTIGGVKPSKENVLDWCGGGDLNPYALRRKHLKLVRLPISPPPHWPCTQDASKAVSNPRVSIPSPNHSCAFAEAIHCSPQHTHCKRNKHVQDPCPRGCSNHRYHGNRDLSPPHSQRRTRSA